MTRIKVSLKGLEAMKRELTSLEKELSNLQKAKNSTISHKRQISGSYELEQAEVDEWLLYSQISKLRERISSAVVIADEDSATVVNFGATVEIIISDSKSETEMQILFSDSDEQSDLVKVSANSPLGEVIFRQKPGYVGTYTVQGNTFTVEIKKIEY